MNRLENYNILVKDTVFNGDLLKREVLKTFDDFLDAYDYIDSYCGDTFNGRLFDHSGTFEYSIRTVLPNDDVIDVVVKLVCEEELNDYIKHGIVWRS